jgi:hypothetical protein
MTDVNSNILINIDTTQAMSALRGLDKQISALNRSMIVGTKAASLAQADFSKSLLHNINATGMFNASMGKMSTSTDQFSRRLEAGKLSLREYYRYGMASTKTFGKNYGREFQTISNLAEKRVKALQSQYVQLGKDAQGAIRSMRITPKALNYNDMLTRMSMTVQRQQIMNKLLDDGATKLLNFGKNTQWAGRQLMVGFTIPLAIFAGSAIKAFKEIETQAVRFKKVYGDIFTTQDETDKALKNMKDIAKEYTKYGLKVSETIKMAADAAAAGNSGQQLETVVKQANKLAVLGGVAQDKALETTIALQNAFQIGSGELSKTMDFLNSVENQTVLSLEDLSNAIPRVAPIIKQLGGNVEDLAFFLTAMKEGGISAEQGANALKSGLASLINPSKAASEAAAKLGINLKGIVQDNQGNLRNTVTSFAQALQPLTDLQRAQTIEKVFGKYQFARISALLNNVTKEGTQASRVLRLASASAEELALLSEREMKIQESSPMYKMQAAIEKLKASIAPIGELFAKVLTPVINFFVKLFDKFNNAPEGIKKAVAIIVAAVAGIGPILLMTVGLVANGLANLMKMFNLIRKGFQNMAYGSKDAALGTQYLTTEELENIAVSNSLATSHKALSSAYVLEEASLIALTNAYRQAKVAMSSFASTNPGMFMPSSPRITPPRRFAKGVTSVPGTGNQDTTPALLTPGEAVIPADMARKYAPFIGQMIDGTLPGHMAGRMPLFLGMPKTIKAVTDQRKAKIIMEEIGKATEQSRFAKMDPTDFGVQLEATTGRSFPVQGIGGVYQKPDGTKVFVKPMLDETTALAEQRATIIARDAHGLNAPKQTVHTMIDPTDPLKKRKLIALEAPYTPEFAKPTGKFTKDEYFRQLVASGLRGDKDLQMANLSGNNLVDVGAAGVFDRASGLRAYAKDMPSVEDQVRINLLGVKGSNTRRFFAEATTNIPKGMTPAEYNQAMIDEINLVLPKLRRTVSGFNLNKDEQAIYQGMIRRLEDTKGANWREIHGIHSSVIANPKKALTPAAIKKIEDEITLRARQKGHASSLSDKEFMDGFAKWAQGNGFAKGGVVPEYMAGRLGMYGAAAAMKVSGAKEASTVASLESRTRLPLTPLPPGMPFKISNLESGMSQIQIGGQSMTVKASDAAKFEGNWKEFEAAYPDKTIYAQKVKDLEARILEYKLKDKSLTVGTTSGKGLFANVYPWSIARKRETPPEVNKRWQKVLADPSKNKPAQKLLNYYAEELASVKKNLVNTRKISEADALAVLKAPDFKTAIERVRSGEGGIAASHIKATGQNRDLEFWPAGNVVRDQSVVNSGMNALSKRMGAIHVTTEKEALIALSKLESKKHQYKGWGAKNKADTWTTTDIITEHLLRKRIRDGYYKKQKFKDSDYMPADTLALSKGIFSVPGPKGAGDIQPAMLSPGEAVIPAKQTAKYRPLIQSMINGTVPEHGSGRGGKGGNRGIPRPSAGYTMVDKGDGWGATPVANPAASSKASNVFSTVTKHVSKFGTAVTTGTKAVAANAKATTANAKITDKFRRSANPSGPSGPNNPPGPKDKTRGFGGYMRGYGGIQDAANGKSLNANERVNSRQDMRMQQSQRGMGLAMGAMMLPMVAQGIAAGSPDSGIGKLISSNMTPILMASMIPMLAPLFNAPWKILAATVVSLVVAFKMQGAAIRKSIQDGLKQGEAIGNTTASLESFGSMIGAMSATQIMAKRRQDANLPFTVVDQTFGKDFSGGEFGKKFIEEFKTYATTNAAGSAKQLGTRLANAVSQGVLSSDQAASIIANIARDMGDRRLELDATAVLRTIIGPDGQNLTKNPLKVQTDIILNQQDLLKQTQTIFADIVQKEMGGTIANFLQKIPGMGVLGLNTGINKMESLQLAGANVGGALGGAAIGSRVAVGSIGAVGNMASAGANASKFVAEAKYTAEMGRIAKVMRSIEIIQELRTGALITEGGIAAGTGGVASVPAGIAAAVTLAVTAVADIAVRRWQQGKEKKAVGAASGVIAGGTIQNLTQAQQSIDVIKLESESRIKKLLAEEAVAKTAEKRLKIEKDIQAIRDKALVDEQTVRDNAQKGVDSSVKFLDTIQSKDAKVKYVEAYRTAYQDKYKDVKGPEKLAADQLSYTLQNGLEGKVGLLANTAETDKKIKELEAQIKANREALLKDPGNRMLGQSIGYQEQQLSGLKNTKNVKQDALKIETLVTASVVSGGISASSAQALVDNYLGTGKDILTNWNLQVSAKGIGLEAMDKLGWIMQNINNKADKTAVYDFTTNLPQKEAEAYLNVMQDFISMPPELRINLTVESDPKNREKVKAIGEDIDALNAHFPDGKVTEAKLQQYKLDLAVTGKDNKALDLAVKNWGILSKYDPSLRLEASVRMNELLVSESFKKDVNTNLIKEYQKLKLWKDAPKSMTDSQTNQYNNTQLKALNPQNRDVQQQVQEKTLVEALNLMFAGYTADLAAQRSAAAAAKQKAASNFLDDLGQKLKMIRDKTFDALHPLQALYKAFANSGAAKKGLGALFDAFSGVSQLMNKSNLAPDLKSYISGLSAEDFKTFEQLDLNPTVKGKQTPFKYKQKNGKDVLDKNGHKIIVGFSDALLLVNEAFNSLAVGMAQLNSVEALKGIENQKIAFDMLTKSGMNVVDALTVIEDQGVASAIASGTLGATGSEEMKKFVADISKANKALEKQQVIKDTLSKNAEFNIFKQTPEVINAMKSMNFSADQIDAVLNNPAMLKQFSENLKDGKVDIAAIEGSTGAISQYLKDIESKKLIDIQINFNKGDYAQVASSGLDMVNQMFAVQEDLITTGVDSRSTKDVAQLAANESKIKELESQLRPYQTDIENLQYKINDIQASVSLNISQKVDAYQKEINDLQHQIDVQFNEPIQALQDQSNVLSHDMDLIAHAAEEVNKRYDQQTESLTVVKEINDAILSQQEKQIGLADALTSGDISAAGKAMQDMRKASADLYSNAAQKSFELARKNELDRLVATQGLTQDQIKEKQYQISQDIYALETDPKKLAFQDSIKSKTKSIYTLEQARAIALEQVQGYENEIAKITKDNIIDKERMIAALNTENETIQARLDKLKAETLVLGQNREAWAAIEAKVKAYDLSRKDLDTAFAALLAASTAINDQWTKIMEKIGAYAATPAKDSKIMTTAQTIVTNSGSTANVAKSEADAKTAADKITADAKAAADKIVADAKAAADKSKAEADALLAAALKAAEEKEAALKALADATTAAEKAAAQKVIDAAAAAEAKYKDAADKAIAEAADAALAAEEAAAIAILGIDASDYAISVITGIGDDLVASSNALIAGSETTAAALNTMVDAADAAGQAFIAITNGTKEFLKYKLMTDDQMYQATADAITSSYTGDTASMAKGADANYDANGPKNFYAGNGQVGNGKDALVDKAGGIGSYGPLTQSFFTVDGQPYSGNLLNNNNIVGLAVDGVPVWLPNLPGGTKWNKYITESSGGLIPQFFASGGYAMGTDTVPAMLTPGEFVMSKYAVNTHGADKMKAINNGDSVGDAVYNYSISVNVKSDANPDEIARSVMAQIKQIDSQKIRGSRF